MKKQKAKLLTKISLMSIFCVTLSSCDPGNFQFTSEELAEVKSIELINYNNPEQEHFLSWVPDHYSDLKPFENEKMSRLETLDESKITDFVADLCKCHILSTYYAYDSPNGNCLKLNYANGNFLIIWSDYEHNSFSGYIGTFTSSGEVDDFVGCFEDVNSYKGLVNDYFQTQI